MKNKADILISYQADKVSERSIVVPLYVRPESNRVDYEALIVKGLKNIGTPIFMANYNGQVISQNHIVMNHYFSHYLFALHGRQEITKYPEIIKAFEKKFNINFLDADILGSVEYLKQVKSEQLSEEQLFHYYASEQDFLQILGTTFKRINNSFIINYDIPAILKRYNSSANILVFVILLKDQKSIEQLNFSLYEQLRDAGILGTRAGKTKWYNQVRRIYHLPNNHVEAMLDLTDYTVYDNYQPLHYSETPLGRLLVKYNIFNLNEMDNILNYFKKYPLTYINTSDGQSLVNVRESGAIKMKNHLYVKNFNECIEVFKEIVGSRN